VNHAKKREKALRSQFALLNVVGTSGDFGSSSSIRVRHADSSGARISGKSERIENAASLVCHLLVTAVPGVNVNSEDVFSDYSGLTPPFDSNGSERLLSIGPVRVALHTGAQGHFFQR